MKWVNVQTTLNKSYWQVFEHRQHRFWRQ